MTDRLICCRCRKEIIRSKDRWVNVRDFDKDELKGDKVMHFACWKDIGRQTIQKAFNEKAKQLSPMLSKIIGNFGGLTQNA